MADQNTLAPADLVEQICRATAKADGLDWDEVCGCDTEAGDCESSTSMAAWDEDHDAALSRRYYRKRAQASIAAMQTYMASEVVVRELRLQRIRVSAPSYEGPTGMSANLGPTMTFVRSKVRRPMRSVAATATCMDWRMARSAIGRNITSS